MVVSDVAETLEGTAGEAACKAECCSYHYSVSLEGTLHLLAVLCKQKSDCQDTDSMERLLATQNPPYIYAICYQGELIDSSSVQHRSLCRSLS